MEMPKITRRTFLKVSAGTTAAAAAAPRLLNAMETGPRRQGFQSGNAGRTQGDPDQLPRLQHPGRRHRLRRERPRRQAGRQPGARVHARPPLRQGQRRHVVQLRPGPHPLPAQARRRPRRGQVEAHHLGRGAGRGRAEAGCSAQGGSQHHHAEVRPQPHRRRHRPLHEDAGLGHGGEPHLGVRIVEEDRHGADLGAGHRDAGLRQRQVRAQLRLQRPGGRLLPQPAVAAASPTAASTTT